MKEFLNDLRWKYDCGGDTSCPYPLTNRGDKLHILGLHGRFLMIKGMEEKILERYKKDSEYFSPLFPRERTLEALYTKSGVVIAAGIDAAVENAFYEPHGHDPKDNRAGSIATSILYSKFSPVLKESKQSKQPTFLLLVKVFGSCAREEWGLLDAEDRIQCAIAVSQDYPISSSDQRIFLGRSTRLQHACMTGILHYTLSQAVRRSL